MYMLIAVGACFMFLFGYILGQALAAYAQREILHNINMALYLISLSVDKVLANPSEEHLNELQKIKTQFLLKKSDM